MGSGASQQQPPPPPSRSSDSQASERPSKSSAGKSMLTRQAERLGYPPPAPPKTTKEEIFILKEYIDIDKRALSVPQDVMYKSYDDLVAYLTKDLETDLQKLRALFRWVTSLDISSLEQSLPKLPEPGSPCDYLLKIQWRMGNHAHFFAQLARVAKIPCLVITGINKSAAYKLGSSLDREGMAAQWNAVYIDGNWRLLDVFWASTVLVGKKSKDWALMDEGGEKDNKDDDSDDNSDDGEGEAVHTVNEFFFIPDPDQFACTHLPDEPLWQLVNTPVTENDFETFVYIRERFFQLNLAVLPDSKKKCFISAEKGQVVLKFGLESDVALAAQFRYLLYKNRQPGEKISNMPFERFVFFEKKEQEIKYTIQFPLAGLFKMDVYGQNTKIHETLDLICSYLIDCKVPQSKAEPLPSCPDIGWGPGVEAKEKGLKPKTHQDGIIDSKDGNVEIRFNMDDPINALQSLKHNQLDEWLLSRFAVIRTEGKELVINIRLPASGEYALEMFADKEGAKGDLPNVCNYLIKCTNDKIKPAPFPKLHEGILGKSTLADALRIRAISHPGSIIETDDGKINLQFECDDPDIEILCELQHNTISTDDLTNSVEKISQGKQTDFQIGLPRAGEYGLNIFARKKSEGGHLYHVHTYLVQSTQKKNIDTQKQTDVPTVTPLITGNNEIEVKIPARPGKLVGELTRKNADDGMKSNELKSSRVGDEDVFKAKLPKEGEYKLDVFEDTGKGTLKHAGTYQLIKDNTHKEPEKVKTPPPDLSPEEQEKLRKQKAKEAVHKAQRDKLKAAMMSQNAQLIQQAIREFESSGTPEAKGELDKARDTLNHLKLSEALTAAMGSRSLEKLEKVVAAVEKSGLQKKLNLQLAMAYRIIEQLRRIEKLRHEIMKLDQRTIAEIKSYSTPPEVVHKVMMATFLLLGERERDLKNWKAVVVLIGKTGKESLKRRVSQFAVENLKIDVAVRTKDLLSLFDLNDVRDVSSGAATFFVWNMGMVEECESRYMQNGGDLSAVQTKKSAKRR